MTRARSVVGAGGLWLLLLAGCKGTDLTSLLLLESTAAGRERVIAGSLQSVATSTQAVLRQLDVKTVVTEEAGTMRIAGTTRSGTKFKLVLTQAEGEEAKQTRVQLEWEGTPDDQFGFQVLGQLAAIHRR